MVELRFEPCLHLALTLFTLCISAWCPQGGEFTVNRSVCLVENCSGLPLHCYFWKVLMGQYQLSYVSGRKALILKGFPIHSTWVLQLYPGGEARRACLISLTWNQNSRPSVQSLYALFQSRVLKAMTAHWNCVKRAHLLKGQFSDMWEMWREIPKNRNEG